MSSIYDFEKQYEVLNRTVTMWDSIIRQMDVVSKLDNMTAALETFQSNISSIDGINLTSNTLDFWSRQFDAFKSLEQINLSKLFGVEKSIQNIIKTYDFSAINSVLNNLTRISGSQAMVGMSAALEAYDAVKFSSAIVSVLRSLTAIDKLSISDFVEEVTEQYIDKNELSDEAAEEIRTVATAENKGVLTEKQLRVWEVYIYPFLISLLFYILSSKQPEPVVMNNITYVNNYYTTEVGIQVEVLNEYNFRIVCENNVRPRIKPDCSSKVVEELPFGKVVCVVEKYKKWIEITWENDEGEYCSGWIQNYKVKKFK